MRYLLLRETAVIVGILQNKGITRESTFFAQKENARFCGSRLTARACQAVSRKRNDDIDRRKMQNGTKRLKKKGMDDSEGRASLKIILRSCVPPSKATFEETVSRLMLRTR